MLEEILRSEKHNPAEAASSLLLFVQGELSSGSSNAEARFFHIFGPLCERIFGPMLGPQEDFRHKDGGWLSAQTPWRVHPSSSVMHYSPPLRDHLGRRAGLSRTGAVSIEADPVFIVLAPSTDYRFREQGLPTLVESIARVTDNRPEAGFPFPFHALPQSMRDAWLALVEASMGGQPPTWMWTANDSRLIATLLRKRPEEQNDLRIYRQRIAQTLERSRQPLQLSPRGFNNAPPANAAAAQTQQQQMLKEDVVIVEESSPKVMLSMLEYFLFLFLRYPLAAPVPKHPVATGAARRRSSQRRDNKTFGEELYFILFESYIHHFLPHRQDGGASASAAAAASASAAKPSPRDSEFFLRSIVAMWLESHSRVTPVARVVQSILVRRRRAGCSEPPRLDLNLSYDLVHAVYEPPPPQVQKCLRIFCIHVVLDPEVRRSVTRRNKPAHQWWCLTDVMTSLQQSFYNHIRTTFRHASIHSPSSPFYSALNAWLIWIEPWNAYPSKKSSYYHNKTRRRIMDTVRGRRKLYEDLFIPTYYDPSEYDPSWEPYIVANLYIYVVPLALFLRRARELDFSSRKFERSIRHVKRVFRVFTPRVVDVLSRYLDGSSPELAKLVERHSENLGPYAPPAGRMSLSSCQADIISLLDEIHMQRRARDTDLDIFDRVGAYLKEKFEENVYSAEEKGLRLLTERARVIVRLPDDYPLFSQLPGKSSRASAGNGRSEGVLSRAGDDGGEELSPEGRDFFLNGGIKFSGEDVSYRGDKMRSRVRSHEIGPLVILTGAISDWLNAKLGLVGRGNGDGGAPAAARAAFRINLRFLADYRNWVFALATGYFLTKML